MQLGSKEEGSFHLFALPQEEKLSPPGRLFVPLALTQGEGAKQSQVLQRVSDLPSGPFLRAGDVLPLRLYALGSLCLCAQNISYSSPSPLARLAVRPGARGRRCCLSQPDSSPHHQLVSTRIPALRCCFPRAKPPRASPRAREPCALIISWIYLPHFHAAGAQRHLPWSWCPGTEELGVPASLDHPRL